MSGQRNLMDAVAGTIRYTAPETGKQYALAEKTATLMVRPRGRHLDEAHIQLERRPVPGGLVDFVVAFVVLLALMAYWGVVPGVAARALPAFLVLALATALGVGLWLAALNVQYRDVRHTIPLSRSSGCSSRRSPMPRAWFQSGGAC